MYLHLSVMASQKVTKNVVPWHFKAKIIGVVAALSGFLLILVDDFIPRYQQGRPIFDEISEILEFIVLCPGVGILGLLAAQYFIQREHDYKKRIEQEEARRFVALGRIAGSIAHEVRNPMQNIKLVLEELRADAREDQREFIDHIDENLERINMVVKLAYELARPDYHSDQEIDGSVNVALLIETVVGAVRENTRHQINIEEASGSCRVNGSATAIQVALENVLRNAVQSCDENKNQQVISVKRYIEGRFCCLEVVNKGELPKELLSGDAVTFTSRRAGLGLGLFIARHLLERMQGQLNMNQQGTDVIVTFKIPKSDDG